MHPVQVLLPLPLHKTFTYLCAEKTPGMLVNVSWRAKQAVGVVVEPCDHPPEGVTLKNATVISSPHDNAPIVLPKVLLDYIHKVAEYTLTPVGLVLKMLLSGSDFKKAILQTTDLPYTPNLSPLEEDQEKAFQAIVKAQESSQFKSFLLDGVTGSGKTEVYFHALEKALQAGKQALVMIPEIGLTQSWVTRFLERFGRAPLFWHSEQTPKNKRLIWQAAYDGTPHIFVGTRSSLFLPYTNLNLIVVDEEHDTSYKQEEQVLYHARDMAILKAHMEGFPIILASATPSLESLHNVTLGKSDPLKLTSRYNKASLPSIHMLDKRKDQGKGWISKTLEEEIQKRLLSNEQSLLFLNRRGFAPITLCKGCGHRFECPGCSTTLVQHKVGLKSELRCHYCTFHTLLPSSCPACHINDSFVPIGPGVERVYEEACKKFPKASIVTLTSDMTAKEQNAVWEEIHNKTAEIIIGTQLLAKGHHIPNLTLVGIVDADMGLCGSDLRASEKTFQLLQQVAGRAGRENKKGHVYLQSYQPEHPLFHALMNYDQDEFLAYESSIREKLGFPPFARMASILLTGLNERDVLSTAQKLARHLRHNSHVQILGPAPSILARLKSRYRYRILIKSQKSFFLGKWLSQELEPLKIPTQIRVSVDIDPISFQ